MIGETMWKYFLGAFLLMKGCDLTLEDRFDRKFDKKDHCECEKEDIKIHFGPVPEENETHE